MRCYDSRVQDEIIVLSRTMKPNAGGGERVPSLSGSFLVSCRKMEGQNPRKGIASLLKFTGT